MKKGRILLFLLLVAVVPMLVEGQVRQNAEALQPKSSKMGKQYEKTNGLFRFDVIGGANFSQYNGDLEVGFRRVGAHVGLGATLPITEHWNVGLELLYSMKGAYQKVPRGTYYTYDLNLDYIEIPILAHYTYDVVSIGVGFSYGRLINFQETVHSGHELAGSLEEAQQIWGAENIKTGFGNTVQYQYAIPLDVYDPETGWTEGSKWAPGMFTTSKMKYNDWSVLVDLKIRVWKNLGLGLRYTYSMAPLRSETYTIGAQGAVITDYTNNQLYDEALYNETGSVQRINEVFFDSRKQYNSTLTARLIWTFNWNGKSIKEKRLEM